MLLYIFLVLGVWNGVTGKEDLCEEPEYRVCRMPDLEFPQNEEDINRVCPIIIEKLECLKNYYDTCAHEEDSSKEKLPEILELVNDACRENSPLHLGLVQHIGCYNEVIDNDIDSCHKSASSAATKMRNYLHEIEVERGYHQHAYHPELWLPLQCMVQSYQFSCFVSKTAERCGTDAKDVATEFLTRSSIADRSCSNSSEEILAELVVLLELELEEESALRTFIRKE